MYGLANVRVYNKLSLKVLKFPDYIWLQIMILSDQDKDSWKKNKNEKQDKSRTW